MLPGRNPTLRQPTYWDQHSGKRERASVWEIAGPLKKKKNQSWSPYTGSLLCKTTFPFFFFLLNNWELGFLLPLAKGSCFIISLRFFKQLKYGKVKKNNSKKLHDLKKAKYISLLGIYIQKHSCPMQRDKLRFRVVHWTKAWKHESMKM